MIFVLLTQGQASVFEEGNQVQSLEGEVFPSLFYSLGGTLAVTLLMFWVFCVLVGGNALQDISRKDPEARRGVVRR